MSKGSKSSGISIVGLLGVAFIILKLCHVIDWNWWWVLAPFWGGIAIGVVLLIISLILAIIIHKSK
jgi:phosphoglycerol transferase MdoB-like AlkP superfamily enzyme